MATRVRPNAWTRAWPKRATKPALRGAKITSMKASGRVARPAWKGEKPSTNCRYWVSTKNRPNMAKNVRVMVVAPTLNRRLAKNVHGQHGVRVVALPGDEAEGEDGEHREAAHRAGRAPAVHRGLDDGVEQRGQGHDAEQGADGVQPTVVGVLRGGDQQRPGHDGQNHDGHVDEEDRAPPEVLEQEPAHHRAEGGAGAGETGPDGDGPGPLLGREHVGQDGQRGGHDERGARIP